VPDETTVTVEADDDRENERELSAEELAELDAAVAEADADDTLIPHETVLAELDRIVANA
jgi:hypothetical protein